LTPSQETAFLSTAPESLDPEKGPPFRQLTPSGLSQGDHDRDCDQSVQERRVIAIVARSANGDFHSGSFFNIQSAPKSTPPLFHPA
jgi:hypothetical protein